MNKLDELEEKFRQHRHTGTDSVKLDIDFDDLTIVKKASVSSPTGGATIDSQARAAIDSIITRLEQLGLIEEN